MPKKGGLGHFADLRGEGGPGKKGGGFEEGWYPNAHYEHSIWVAKQLKI